MTMRDNDYSLNLQICMCTWDGRTDGQTDGVQHLIQ